MPAGQRNRKRALPAKPENSPVVESKPLAGRKSEPEAVLAVPPNLEAVTPPPQRRKSMAGLHSCRLMSVLRLVVLQTVYLVLLHLLRRS